MAIYADGTRYILTGDGATPPRCSRTLAASAGVKSRGFGPSSLNR